MENNVEKSKKAAAICMAMSDDKSHVGLRVSDEFRMFDMASPSDLADLESAAENPDVLKVGSDLKDIMKVLSNHGITLAGPFFDIGIAKAMLDPATTADIKLAPDDSKKLRDTESLLRTTCHAIKDAKEKLCPLMDKEGVRNLFDVVEMPLIPVIADMEMTGLQVDRDWLVEAIGRLEAERERLAANIFRETGNEFNIDDMKRLSAILYDKCGYMPTKRTATGFSVGKEALSELPFSDLPIYLLLYNETTHMLSELRGCLAEMDDAGVIRPTFNQVGTTTGRIISREPNVQGYSVHIKKFVKSRPGNVLLCFDYSQMQLRILAHESVDSRLIPLFRDGGDVHSLTAAVIKADRGAAKTVNFGVLFGMTPLTLSEELNRPLLETKAFVKGFFKSYNGARKLRTTVNKQAKGSDGAVTSPIGRKRYFRDKDSRNKNGGLKKAAQRGALAALMQMCEADIVKRAMLRTKEELSAHGYHTRLVCEVHDELLYECPESEAAEVCALIKQVMESAAPLDVPLVTEVGMGSTWAEAKKH